MYLVGVKTKHGTYPMWIQKGDCYDYVGEYFTKDYCKKIYEAIENGK